MHVLKDSLEYFRAKFARPEGLIVFIAVGLGAAYASLVYRRGLTAIFIDQNAHLNLARQVFDSMTPGINQLGFWPPLLHVIMSVPASIDVLFATGLAGPIVLIPFLALGALFTFKLVHLLTGGDRPLAFLAALLFVANPYILYYSVTPMMEVLFLAHLVGSAYFLAAWMHSEDFRHILGLSIFLALASISRFEGLILLPIAASIVLTVLVVRGTGRKQIEALLILFSMVAALGYVAIILYGFVFAGNPLEFMNSQWSASAQQRDFFLPAFHNILAAGTYLLKASYYMLGTPQMLVAMASAAVLSVVALWRKRFDIMAVLALLAAPFLFILLSLYRGDTVLYVPELAPFGTFFNERYGLSLSVFAVVAPIVLVGLLQKIFTVRYARWPLRRTLALSFAALLIVLNVSFLFRVTFVENFAVLNQSVASYQTLSEDQLAIADTLGVEYDWGKIFITKALNNYVPVAAGIGLSNYIQESNYPFYDQTLEHPWLFARWVVMYNGTENDRSSWRQRNEKISVTWGRSAEFTYYYELVDENKTIQLYKIRQDVIQNGLRDAGVRTQRVPSLNADITRWDPNTIYEEMNPLKLPATAFSLVSVSTLVSRGNAVLYEVEAGDSLWAIAGRVYGDEFFWTTIAEGNDIEEVGIIRVGQVLAIPSLQ
jgi:hypothetical protein